MSEPGQWTPKPESLMAMPQCPIASQVIGGTEHSPLSILQRLYRISVTVHTWKWRKQASERFRDLSMDTKQEMMLLEFEPGSV